MRSTLARKDMEYDFAISYADEDRAIADEIYKRLKQTYEDFKIFFAPFEQHNLVGKDGESFFEDLFSKCSEVIVLVSRSYRAKKWTRFEWDVILERNAANRFIPVKIDDAKIIGLPSNVIYVSFSGNYDEIVELCIKKLLLYEKERGIKRESEYSKILNSLKLSEGSLDKAYQLVVDNRHRTPLDDIHVPNLMQPKYEIVSTENLDYSMLKRIQIRVALPPRLTKEEVRLNLEHCMALVFNKEKPDALSLFAYCRESASFFGFKSKFNVARADFAPYGKWERAEEGFAYNLPVSKFEFRFEFATEYFT